MAARFRSKIFSRSSLKILLPSALLFLLFAGSVFFFLLPSMENTFLEHKKKMLAQLTNAAVDSLVHLNEQAESGTISLEEAQRRARGVISDMRYGEDEKDYFWINNTEPRMVMHPYQTELNGQDLSDYEDRVGTRLFVKCVEETRETGEGYVEYYWQWKDDPETIAKKLSHVRRFEPWGWIVGTGVYLDDVDNELGHYQQRISFVFGIILLIVAGLSYTIMRQIVRAEARKDRALAQRERLFRALKEGEERYRSIADFTYDWEIWLGTEEEVLYCSPSCQRITGYPPEQFFERPELIRDIIIGDDQDAWDSYLKEARNAEGDFLDFRITTSDGYTRWLNAAGRGVRGINNKPLGVRVSLRDITDRKKMEEQLRHQALHDPLTELANRTLCQDRIGQAMQRAGRRENYYFAVVFLDLDRFKLINDSLGHRFGDMVLVETAERLTRCVRVLDTVSRFGGDEFVLLLDELSSPGESIQIIKRIRDELAKPFEFEKGCVQTTASFGVVLSPTKVKMPAEVLQRANIAMHRAKEAGRNRFKIFTDRMLENAVEQLNLENDMRRGLDSGEFSVEFQPIMDLSGADLMGFEALARWRHPERGLISPSEFIPMAEESGLILPLGEWVLKEALEHLARWREETDGAEGLFMSVNLSSKQFVRPELDKIVMQALHDAGVPPEALKMEITESAIMDHPEAAVHTLKRLRAHGVRFSIDDFGTGYSSLSQLQKLPVDTLKVDRSFISRMKRDPENMEIVKAVIALAHSLELDVVAEGVEEVEQLCSLIGLSCECVQGFYFHKPLTETEARQLLENRASDAESSPRESVSRVKRDCDDLDEY